VAAYFSDFASKLLVPGIRGKTDDLKELTEVCRSLRLSVQGRIRGPSKTATKLG